MEGPSNMLTVKEAATLAKVHQETVRVWLRTGAIHGQRLHGTGPYRIPADELQRFLSGAPGGERA